MVSDLGHPSRPSTAFRLRESPQEYNLIFPRLKTQRAIIFLSCKASTSGINDFSTGLQGKSINGALQFKWYKPSLRHFQFDDKTSGNDNVPQSSRFNFYKTRRFKRYELFTLYRIDAFKFFRQIPLFDLNQEILFKKRI